MYICVTHVDSSTGIPCTVAPMSQGPSFPKVKGLTIEFGNQTQWPTNEPLFFGTCDNDADTTIPGIICVLTEDEYKDEQRKENEIKAMQMRQHRDFLLRTEVDSVNPMRWETMEDTEKTAIRNYRKALLDIPQQTGFPWEIKWPTKPEEQWSV